MSSAARLPTRFPVGTRFVIEGRAGEVYQRYVEFPDGRHIDLRPPEAPHPSSRRRRSRRNPGRK